MKVPQVLLVMAAVYVFNHVFGWLYRVWPNFDIPMHILGGLLAALLGLAFWQELILARKIKNVPPIAVALFLICFACLIAVLWEFHEFIIDTYARSRIGPSYVPMQASLADTMKDLLDGLIGASLGTIVFWKRLGNTTL